MGFFCKPNQTNMKYIALTLFLLGAVTIDSTGIHFAISVAMLFVGLFGLILTETKQRKP